MSQYGKTQYWDERYTRDSEPFDWYQRFSGIKDIITANVQKQQKVLYIGAGNSRMGQQMLQEGYKKIICIDQSNVCVKAMSQKYKQKQGLKYTQMDAKTMSFHEGQFDAVLDKATLDSVLCGQNSTANANKMISQIYRVLSKNGTYICVSYGQPQYRLSYLQKPQFEWTVKVQQVAKPTIASSVSLASDQKESPNVHYIFICRKGQKV